MERYVGIAVVIVLSIALMIYLCKRHINLVFSLLLRTIFGIFCIYVINTVLGELELISPVGMNWISILVAAAFGVPGIILLYGGVFLLSD